MIGAFGASEMVSTFGSVTKLESAVASSVTTAGSMPVPAANIGAMANMPESWLRRAAGSSPDWAA